MVKYHPDARFLTDYSAGSLPEEQALCVATHLHYCAACRVKVRELVELGSELFMQQQAPAATSADSDFERLMARVADVDVAPAQASDGARVAPVTAPSLPRALHKLTHGDIETLKWRRVGRSFRYSRLKVGNPQRETSLLQIKAGGSVPHHRHAGDEITVIISGSFSDQDDKYGVGDFIVRTTGEKHSPVASQDEDCLCLATLDKPIVMSNLFYRLLAPLF
jgi:putative transcriptional regulator